MKISTGTSGWSIGSYTNYAGVGYVSQSVPSSAALEHSALLRGTQSIANALSKGGDPVFVTMAPDEWSVGVNYTIERSTVMRGSGYGTLIEAEAGVVSPFFTISASNVTISGIRFKGGATVTKCLYITGNDVTIQDCVFDGFATSIHVNGAARFVIKNCRFLNQTNAIDIDDGDYGIISENHIQSVTASQIILDGDSHRNTVSVNNAGDHASAISVSTSGSTNNVKTGNQPPAVTT